MLESGENFLVTDTQYAEWKTVLGLSDDATMADMAKAALAAGDSNMARIYEHVKNDGGNIWEQIDKNTGEQASATGLTWSYANILEALHFRKYTQEKLESIKTITSA
jgi:GH15 family glucan-1,4-alpha-glucosidase